MSKDKGWVSLHRKIWENPISRKPDYLSVWVYIVSNANFKDNYAIINNKKTLIKRGSFFSSISKISEFFKISRSKTKIIIDYFENDQMLYTDRTRNYTIFHILNYDQYQEVEHKQNTDRTPPAITNNDNNDNNDYISPYIPLELFKMGLQETNWVEFLKIRKKSKAVNSERALKILEGQILKIYNEGHDINEIIENSIANSWKSVYAPKGKRNAHENMYDAFKGA